MVIKQGDCFYYPLGSYSIDKTFIVITKVNCDYVYYYYNDTPSLEHQKHKTVMEYDLKIAWLKLCERNLYENQK
jgi:hypothetical protein